MADFQYFQSGSGVYICSDCGKRTRETGDGESGCGLCVACFDEAGAEKHHNDCHDTPVEGCRYCEESGEVLLRGGGQEGVGGGRRAGDSRA